jgi:tRNA threonylcarbamoyladenosine biosynthesis protein TsaB
VILGIDTSTDWCGIAIQIGDRIVQRNWEVGRHGTTAVAPAIQELLADAGIRVEDLTACAVATGPGSFSGLRVGISLAKGFAFARGVDLIGIPTLEIALARIPAGSSGVAVLRAGRSRFVWAKTTSPDSYRTGKIEDLVNDLRSGPVDIAVGEIRDAEEDALVTNTAITVMPAPDRLRQAGDLLVIASRRLAEGAIADPVSLSPLYLHPGVGTPS